MTNVRSTTNKSTSNTLTYLKATFTSPELHPKAKAMKQFYLAIGESIKLVTSTIKNTESDLAFKKAANIFSHLILSCKDIETEDPNKAAALMQNWIKEMKEIGTQGVMDVQGEASRMFAQQYIGLLQQLINKEFWPVPTTPRLFCGLFGPSFATVYPINFENGNKERYEKTIKILLKRIDDFDQCKLLENSDKVQYTAQSISRDMKSNQ
jgi:hypothetical protein